MVRIDGDSPPLSIDEGDEEEKLPISPSLPQIPQNQIHRLIDHAELEV